MTTASATPQQMRDRLLQAIDSQSNICNMVAVLDVISNLEKYPITKEALEETRLGKLINDVRKKTKDEDLAKRAKKLLRNWQKLIEPGQSDTPSRGTQQGGPGSANGGSHPCRPDTPSSAAPPPSKIAPELKTRNDIHNTYSPVAEKSTSRKRKGDPRDSPHLQSKIQKTLMFGHPYSSTPPSNGIGASPQPVPEKLDEAPSDRNRLEHLENDRQSKIPVNAVKPHPSSPAHTKLPSTSSLLKASVLQQQQQQARTEGDAGAASQYSALAPVNASHETLPIKRTSAYVSKGTLQSPAHISAQVPSIPAAVNSPARVHRADSPSPLELHDSLSSQQASRSLSATQEPSDFHRHNFASDAAAAVSPAAKGGPDSASVNKKRKKYRSRDYTVNLQGQPAEDRTKPVRLKERRLTFDPVTGQIKPLTPKEAHHEEESLVQQQQQQQQQQRPPSFVDPVRTDDASQQATATPNPFQQTNWKELSRNEIIQSYLNLQSNVLTSSGAQTPGAHFFMTEYLKREEHDVNETRKTHVLVPTDSGAELPGVSREVTEQDLHRIHNEHWPGVNGCYDTKGDWYDWTECISLDSHGNETKLNILPYVFLD